MVHSKYINRKLTYTDRLELQNYLDSGMSYRAIHKTGLMSKSTILREKKRCKGKYNSDEAQLDADNKAALNRDNSIKTRRNMVGMIEDLQRRIEVLEKRITPQ